MPEEKKTIAPAAPAATTAAETSPAAPPRLGEIVKVRVAAGLRLINNETGQPFPSEAVNVVCSVSTLRRLEDGDLTLA